LGPLVTVKDEHNSLSPTLPKLTLEQWQQLLPFQADDVAFLQKNWDFIFDYIANDHFEVFNINLFKMLNPVVFRMFLQSYQQKQFNFYWRGESNHLDPVIVVGADPYLRLVFCIFFELTKDWIIDPQIGNTIKRTLLPSDPTPLIHFYVEALKLRVQRIVKSAYHWNRVERELLSCEVKADIARLTNICELTSVPCSYVDLINQELARLNYNLKVDEAFFASKV